jgi:hypothetical protein
MNFVDNNSSFVNASFYPSLVEGVAFHVSATQLSESCTRMRVDCLNDHQVLQKSMLFTAVVGLIASISALLFTTVLEFPVVWRTSWLPICVAFVVLMFVGVFAFCFCCKRNNRRAVMEEATGARVPDRLPGTAGQCAPCR